MSQPPIDCVFCKIAAGQIPARIVLRTDAAVAFLDVAPLAEGHLLLVPTRHFATIDQMSADEAVAVCRHIPKLGEAVKQTTGADGFNILQNNGQVAGQVVGHVHFHIIPRRASDGLGYRWNPTTISDQHADELAQMLADRIES